MNSENPISRAPDPTPAVPPTRDGVGPSCVVLPDGPWATVAEFLVERFPGISAETWAARIAAGAVLDDRGGAVTRERPYEPQRRIYYYRSIEAEPRIPFEEVLIYRDEFLVVADKPHFLPVIPSGRYLQETLLVRLKRKLGLDTLAPIHRIDRETAGLVVFTIRPETRGAYQSLFLGEGVRKHYEAIAPWRPERALPPIYRSRLEDDPANFMRMREVPGEANAETRIELLEVRGTLARYGLSPITGRKHQLRVQCAALGIPICNDRIYPVHLAENTDDYARPLQLLAKSIAFADPFTGERREFTSPRAL